MTILKRDIVDRAFKLLAMSGFDLDDSPEDEHDILQTLDDMMSEIQGVDYDFGYKLAENGESFMGDDSGIERDALTGIAHKLALRICSLFGKNPPTLLVSQASDAYNALLVRYQKIPNATRSSEKWNFGAGNGRCGC